ncbi:quinone-dependent dihydroorotate dehydrogenase [Funiculus sociatus GB2-A5]|uniref:Dihydroorotate dehydrogenase (quinone) n=1 Tax=Funiculus sociatus GB2-A5 TaxID=2933946 RepID=A0ABV0JR33_9CYAN|nr:quinone-dependent dihydroorotate dehydrogenase [Trichocoleus sp. FACHB-832]MBD2062671.1 quinone-dependent dihydroorotate dehydrogenase [Trichocoleus sp. FACHB-6]
MDIYQAAIRPVLFSGLKADPEWLHQQTLQMFSALARSHRPPSSWILSQLQQTYCLQDSRLEQTLFGLKFPNPVGLAAGFDKDGVAAKIWQHLGFGFAELGTVTLHSQPGNPRPRLFRLAEDKAALNRMGFNNQGAAAMAARLEALGHSNSQFPIPLGINLGKSKITPLESAAADYLGSFRLLKDCGDYFVVNVSSPNTPGLRSLQSKEQLSLILDALQQENQGEKPILVKIAPDLEWEAIASVIELAQNYHLAGIIATNTTISRDNLKTQTVTSTGKPVSEEAGGISGAPVKQRSTQVIRFIYQETKGKLPIIGVGGIFTAQDAWEKIVAGASLLQVYTGWIYEGPWMVRRILEGLRQKLEEKELASFSDAIGIENQQSYSNPK